MSAHSGEKRAAKRGSVLGCEAHKRSSTNRRIPSLSHLRAVGDQGGGEARHGLEEDPDVDIVVPAGEKEGGGAIDRA